MRYRLKVINLKTKTSHIIAEDDDRGVLMNYARLTGLDRIAKVRFEVVGVG